jgi:hypothetical protein
MSIEGPFSFSPTLTQASATSTITTPTPTTSTSSNNNILTNSTFTFTNTNESYLTCNVKELNVKLYNEIIVSWKINEDTSVNDWIALYKIQNLNYSDYIDINTLSSFNGSKIGHLTWKLNQLKIKLQFKLINDLDDGDLVEFRYYNGIHNKLLAKSNTLKLIIKSGSPNGTNDFITCSLYDVKAAQLRKGMFFNPDPYVKISIVPQLEQSCNYAREYKTSVATNTCFPSWKNEVFSLINYLDSKNFKLILIKTEIYYCCT